MGVIPYTQIVPFQNIAQNFYFLHCCRGVPHSITICPVNRSLIQRVVGGPVLNRMNCGGNGTAHTEISEGIGKMVLTVGVKVLGAGVGIFKKRKCSYGGSAGVEEIHHRPPLPVKGKAVMTLHPAGNTLVVALAEINEMSVGGFNYCFPS